MPYSEQYCLSDGGWYLPDIGLHPVLNMVWKRIRFWCRCMMRIRRKIRMKRRSFSCFLHV